MDEFGLLSGVLSDPLLQQFSHLLKLREDEYLAPRLRQFVENLKKSLHLAGIFRLVVGTLLFVLQGRVAELL